MPRTIKDLVIDAYISEGQMPSYESLTQKIRSQFPTSKWQETHYSWYKSQIRTGRIPIPGVEVDSDQSTDHEVTIDDPIETQVSLEKDLHQYLSSRISEIEPGLVLVDGGIEYATEAGRIDLLAKDHSGHLVVIELKAGKAKDSAIGQILGYIGCLSKSHESVRGILIASDFEDRVVFAARSLANIKLIKYQLSFVLGEIE